MDYQEFNKCVEILRDRPKWFFQRDNLAQKIECLDQFKVAGTPSNISFLVEFLKNDNETVRTKAAEAIIHLYQQLKSQNELYESLKYVGIEKADINFYKPTFSPDIYLHLLSIASMNKSGYVREKAIKELAASQNPNAIKFILLRLGDWVIAVREAAQKAIRAFFSDSFIDEFLKQLPLIDWLLQVQRTDLANIHTEIIEFVFSHELTTDFYKTLRCFDDKTRLIYFRNFLKAKAASTEVVDIIANDRNYLVRAELIKHIQHLETARQRSLISKFLNDRSARVRVNALYQTKNFPSEYDSIIFEMTSDESASVRELTRYLLKNKSFNFADIYRQRLPQNQKLVGSILGLSEVGTKGDLTTFEQHIQSPTSKIKLACLIAIHRIDSSISKKYSLKFLTHPIRRVRNKSVEILSFTCDSEVLEKARAIYKQGDYEQKKTILKLFNQVGGWNIVGDLIIALTDSNENIQNLAWMFLQKWREKATSLFTTPPQTEIKRANEIYRQLDKTKTKLTYYREKLWSELPFYLRG